MDLRDALAITGASVRTHKLRTLLATVGVILGVASVISVVTVGAGMQESFLGLIAGEFDADLVAVSLQAPAELGGPPSFPRVYPFTDRDVDALANLSRLKGVGASVPATSVEFSLGNRTLPGIIATAGRAIGADTNFVRYESGREPSGPGEVAIGNATAARLRAGLAGAPVLGSTLTMRYTAADGSVAWANVTVTAVEKAGVFSGGETINIDGSYAPLTPVNGVPTRVWQAVVARADSRDGVTDVKARMAEYLEKHSDAKDLKGDRLVFRYDTQEDVANLISNSVSQFTAFIGAIGGVSLLVGLVGIANIMLVSVQERTREIGIMKATGASRLEVLAVFLSESVAICAVGAAFGIVLGSLMGVALGELVGAFTQPRVEIPFVFLPGWYLIAVGLGVSVGLVAGLYPAWRAAKVNPVEALRYE